MGTVTLTPADDVMGCPFPFFENTKPSKGFYKIYNDGGHYIATRIKRDNKFGQDMCIMVPKKERTPTFERLAINRVEYEAKKRNIDKNIKKSDIELLDLSKGIGYTRSGVDILFDNLYFQGKKNGLKDTKTDKALTDYVKTGILKVYKETQVESGLDDYIAKKIKRKANNLLHRKKRFRRKAYMNKWNYFVTFTFDDAKHTAETFKKKLRKCLANLHTRRGWRYMGVFELSPEKGRLHFHGLLYIPAGQMVGRIAEKQDYSLSEHKMQIRNENSFFEESFGRNDFCEVSEEEMRNGKRTEYILKYIGKTNERICYSRGIPTEIYKEIEDTDIIAEMRDFGRKYILFDDIIDWERDVMNLRYYSQMTIIDALCNTPLTA